MVTIFTDGSTCKNGSKDSVGGFGVVVVDGDNIVDAYQETGIIGTTNNRMEIEAILWALTNYGDESHREFGLLIPVVYSDSMYCVNSFTNWIRSWKANGWKRAGGKELENTDLIKKYDTLTQKGYQIDLRFIKGHAGKKYNELADQLATGKVTVSEVLHNE